MYTTSNPLRESVTLGEAKGLIKALARDQSLLLLSPPGVGKTDIVKQVADEIGLECRSLLATQIAPEAMQSSTSMPPTPWTASASALT